MNDSAAGLGDRRIEQIGADRGGRMDAEEQYQQRCHQGAATDAGQTDNAANDKTRQCVNP